MGEYERTSTTVVNAYVQPLVQHAIAEAVCDREGSGWRGEWTYASPHLHSPLRAGQILVANADMSSPSLHL
jgi:hypothetical protein